MAAEGTKGGLTSRRAMAWGAGLLAYYGVMRVLTAVLGPFLDRVFPVAGPMDPSRAPAFLVGFVVFFAPLLWLFNRWLAGGQLHANASAIWAYAGITTGCAMAIEVLVDTAFVVALGRPCWTYHVLPIHGGHTSAAGLVMWPLYGFFVWGLHHALEANPRLRPSNTLALRALLVGVDAMVLEVLANTFTRCTVGSWYFFYLADDLGHFTAGEILVPYVLAGFVGLSLLERLLRWPHPWLLGALGYSAAVGLTLLG